jgi:hypothetical protein
MSATPSFPRAKPGARSNLNECIETGEPVFARDMSDSNATKTFFSCSYAYFVEHYYRDMYMRGNCHLYEVLQYTKPTKVFVDIDREFKPEEEALFSEALACFVTFLEQNVSTKNVEYIVLDSSTPVKFSRHVIFNVVCADVQSVQKVVMEMCVLANYSVDMAVYTRNRCFRLPYSSKRGRGVRLLPLGEVPDIATYDVSVLGRSLIQHVSTKFSSFSQLLRFEQREKEKPSGTNHKNTTSEIPGFINDVLGQLRVSALSSASFYADSRFISIVVGGKYCPWKGGVHKSNNSFFTVDCNKRRAWFTCADPECSRLRFSEIDLTWCWNFFVKPKTSI